MPSACISAVLTNSRLIFLLSTIIRKYLRDIFLSGRFNFTKISRNLTKLKCKLHDLAHATKSLHATEGYAPTDFAHQLRAYAHAFPTSGEILDGRIRIILGFICKSEKRWKNRVIILTAVVYQVGTWTPLRRRSRLKCWTHRILYGCHDVLGSISKSDVHQTP